VVYLDFKLKFFNITAVSDMHAIHFFNAQSDLVILSLVWFGNLSEFVLCEDKIV